MSKLSLQNLKPKRIVETDPVQKCIGSFGKFQYMLAAATFLCKVPIAMHQLAHVFLAPKVDYTCGTANKTNVCPCETPEFNKSVFTDTMAMKWKLICKEKWQVSFTQTLFMFGVLIGSIIFGGAADSYGRRRPFLLAITLQFLMSLTLSFAESYTLFLILRGIVGLTVGATMSISFIILMEFIGTEYRELLASLYQLPFNLGHLLLPLIAYFFRDFRKYLLGVSLPGILLFCSYCLIPETPRWLISAKKTDKAVSVMTRVAKMNKLPTEQIRAVVVAAQEAAERNKLKRGNIFDLFRTPRIRRNNLIMAYNWLTCSYVFYGGAQLMGRLSGDMFLSVAANAAVVMLSVILSIPVTQYFGRRTLLIFFNWFCAAGFLLMAVIPKGIVSIILASFGVIGSFIVFVIVYLYCSELFPTVIRNAAMGFSCAMARVGGMVAPFVVEMKEMNTWITPLLFGLPPLLAGFLTFLLPETKGCKLTNTIAEGEEFGKKNPLPRS